MKKILAIVIVLFASAAFAGDEQIPNLLDISVTISTGRAQGSGVLYTRKLGTENVTFVWTAAHVVDDLRGTREVIINGNKRTVVEFRDAAIVQEFRQNGRRIGESKMDARVVRYSNADTGEDLALLEVRKRDFTTSTAKFYLDDAIPTIGTPLYHVGSLHGQVGSNSLTTGVLSQIGRVLALGAAGTVFDQTTATAFPGSSGGGVYLQSDGRYVGMLVRGAGEGFNLIVPTRRIRDWCKASKLEWAIDPNATMPTLEELNKIPVEDAGVVFEPGYKDGKSPTAPSDFPFLIKK